MAFKPNYGFQRSERDRAKKAKKEEKLRKRQERGEASPEPDASEHPVQQAHVRTNKRG